MNFTRTHVIVSSFNPDDPDTFFADLRESRMENVTFYDDFEETKYTTIKKRPTLKLEFQGKFVAAAIRYPSDRKWTNGKRGKITEFSAQSRTRLFDLFHRLDIKYKPVFITLTYGMEYPSAKRAKENLRAFLERIRRMFPNHNVSAVWRIEFQERGAPHFHLLFFGLPFVKKEKIQQMWSEIIGLDDPFTRIEMIRKLNGVMFYVSKYLAKLPGAEISGFNTLTYLHAYGDRHGSSIGRQWGVFQRQHLPLAEMTTMERDLTRWAFDQFRQLAIAQFPRIADYQSPGFRLYVSDAKEWERIARYLFDKPARSKLLSRLTNSAIPLTL